MTERKYGIGKMADKTFPLIIKFTVSNKKNWSTINSENIRPFFFPKILKKYSGIEYTFSSSAFCFIFQAYFLTNKKPNSRKAVLINILKVNCESCTVKRAGTHCGGNLNPLNTTFSNHEIVFSF